jgi:type II secretory pathway pseudopilin PulG
MKLPFSKSNDGFTYIAALVMVVILGIMLAQTAEVWTTQMKREREVELIFRGTQYRDAMRRWYRFNPALGQAQGASLPGQQAARPLNDLKNLLVDPMSVSKVRCLRKLYSDPMTGKEWAVVKDASQRIVGVASTSEAAPIKQANFPFDLDPADFEGKKKYSEWQFIFNHVPKSNTGGGITGQGGSSSAGGTSTK